MKNKFICGLAALCFLVAGQSIYAGTCKVDTNNSKNKGWCVEGVDGKGKCLNTQQEDAARCSENGDNDGPGFDLPSIL